MLSFDNITKFAVNSIYGLNPCHDRWKFHVIMPGCDDAKIYRVIKDSQYVDYDTITTTYTPDRTDISFEVTSPGFSEEIKQYIIKNGWLLDIDYIPDPLIADNQTSTKTFFIKEEDTTMSKVKTQAPTYYPSFMKFIKVIRSGPVTVAWIKSNKKVMIRKTKKDKDDLEKAMLMLFAKSQFSSDAAFHRWFRDQMKLFEEANNNAKN